MEYFNLTTVAEPFHQNGVSLLSNSHAPEGWPITWPDHSSPSTTRYSTFLPGEVTINANSYLNQSRRLESDASQLSNESWDDANTSRKLASSADTVDDGSFQRVLRRRTQNRNAQRHYRQRRDEERKLLQEKLRAAEDECRSLGKTCTELYVVVEMLRNQLSKLEAEKELRAGMYWIPSGKRSE